VRRDGVVANDGSPVHPREIQDERRYETRTIFARRTVKEDPAVLLGGEDVKDVPERTLMVRERIVVQEVKARRVEPIRDVGSEQ
jgi:hypothetical protein